MKITLAILALALVFTACDSQEESDPDIFGLWKSVDVGFGGHSVEAYQLITDSIYVLRGRVSPSDCYRETSLQTISYDFPRLQVGFVTVSRDPITGESEEMVISTEYTVSFAADTLILDHMGPGPISRFVPSSRRLDDLRPICDES